MIKILKEMLGKKVLRLIFVVWPPYGEHDIKQLDISIGFVFYDSPETLFIITTDKNDLTTPYVFARHLPSKIFKWVEFEKRIHQWMNSPEELEIDYEYYEATSENMFQNIAQNIIRDIKLVGVLNDQDPIGIKVIFDDDYILSSPLIDGNTIETKHFNKSNNLNNFLSLGQIVYRKIT